MNCSIEHRVKMLIFAGLCGEGWEEGRGRYIEKLLSMLKEEWVAGARELENHQPVKPL